MNQTNKLYLCCVILTDTHTHLYLEAFDNDRETMIRRAIDQNIKYMLLPNIDSNSLPSLLSTCQAFPENCFPMIGLHPTSVKENYEEELKVIRDQIDQNQFFAVGEIGIDLYWDKTFFNEQVKAFQSQIELSIEKNLPIVIHSRESFNEIMKVLEPYRGTGLKGVFHCFTGTKEQALRVIDFGFYLGIGGVVTFKNSGLDKVIAEIDPEHILLETDSPFLAPVPYRGKRNESSYIQIIAQKIAMIKNLEKEVIADITTVNSIDLFKFIQV